MWWIDPPMIFMKAPKRGMPKGMTTSPSGMLWRGKAIRKIALLKENPLLTTIAVITPKRICVAALAATTGPRVTKNPSVDANPVRAATWGPAIIESMTGTWEARVAEYPTVGMTNCNHPLNKSGIAKAKADKIPLRASSTVLNNYRL